MKNILNGNKRRSFAILDPILDINYYSFKGIILFCLLENEEFEEEIYLMNNYLNRNNILFTLLRLSMEELLK